MAVRVIVSTGSTMSTSSSVPNDGPVTGPLENVACTDAGPTKPPFVPALPAMSVATTSIVIAISSSPSITLSPVLTTSPNANCTLSNRPSPLTSRTTPSAPAARSNPLIEPPIDATLALSAISRSLVSASSSTAPETPSGVEPVCAATFLATTNWVRWQTVNVTRQWLLAASLSSVSGSRYGCVGRHLDLASTHLAGVTSRSYSMSASGSVVPHSYETVTSITWSSLMDTSSSRSITKDVPAAAKVEPSVSSCASAVVSGLAISSLASDDVTTVTRTLPPPALPSARTVSDRERRTLTVPFSLPSFVATVGRRPVAVTATSSSSLPLSSVSVAATWSLLGTVIVTVSPPVTRTMVSVSASSSSRSSSTAIVTWATADVADRSIVTSYSSSVIVVPASTTSMSGKSLMVSDGRTTSNEIELPSATTFCETTSAPQ